MATFYRVNFQTAANEDLRQAFALTDTAGQPVNLTGGTLKMGLEAVAADSHTIVGNTLEASTANGRIVVADAALGQFEIVLPTATLRTFPTGVYRHDLVLTLAGRVQRVWEGTLTLNSGITP
jgi:hypothetical protein